MLSFEQKGAPLEEAILDAFEAANWVLAIFDPIKHDTADDAAKQLENTISRLNKAVRCPWLRFHVRDRRYVRWEDCHPDAKRSGSSKRRPRTPPKGH